MGYVVVDSREWYAQVFVLVYNQTVVIDQEQPLARMFHLLLRKIA